MAPHTHNTLALGHSAQGQKEFLKVGRHWLWARPLGLERECSSLREAFPSGPVLSLRVARDGHRPPPCTHRTPSGTGREDSDSLPLSQMSKPRLTQGRQSHFPKTPSHLKTDVRLRPSYPQSLPPSAHPLISTNASPHHVTGEGQPGVILKG